MIINNSENINITMVIASNSINNLVCLSDSFSVHLFAFPLIYDCIYLAYDGEEMSILWTASDQIQK